MSKGMAQMHDLAPTFDDALTELQQALRDSRREWSGVLMSVFPEQKWMERQAKALKKRLGSTTVLFNALAEGNQTTICSSDRDGYRVVKADADSLCVIAVSLGKPLAVNDVLNDPVVAEHPAASVCRSWASYPVMVNGVCAGTVCALENPHPREWTEDDQAVLAETARALEQRIASWLDTSGAA